MLGLGIYAGCAAYLSRTRLTQEAAARQAEALGSAELRGLPR